MTATDFGLISLGAKNRLQFWARFLQAAGVATVAEIGVWRGEFAETMLKAVPGIERYWMVDAWRHLDGWNKPANITDDQFAKVYDEAMRRTAFASDRRTVLRGTTIEVLDQVPDGSLDFAYVDGDHTLRGITVDLLRVLPKMRPGGWIGGDDFEPNVWEHGTRREPTLVFPYAVYFAEAIGAPVWAPGFNQFLIQVPPAGAPGFTDSTGLYGSAELGPALRRPAPWMPAVRMAVYGARRLARMPR